jgi:hypothetical protein
MDRCLGVVGLLMWFRKVCQEVGHPLVFFGSFDMGDQVLVSPPPGSVRVDQASDDHVIYN